MSLTNNVTRLLDSRRIAYQLYTYDYDGGIHSAVQVATAIGLPAEQVFKSLIVLGNDPKRKPMLIALPGPQSLDLKGVAKAVKIKKAKMASHEQAELLTGLQTGGISPLALINSGIDIYLDDRANNFESIAISAGQRGANILLPVKDLVRLTRSRLITLP